MPKTVKQTILLVEDEAIVALSQKMFLEKYGYKVLTTNTGEKAIEILNTDSQIEIALLPGSVKAPLEKFGYQVIVAASAEKAVALFDENVDIDLVLMDIDLGSGMDGTQAAEIILGRRDIPILFLSSHTEPSIVSKTEKITSYGYVVKNSSITVLDASIKMAFKLFEANMKLKNELADRKRMDEKLSVSETRYRRLFETTKEGILILDAKTGMIIDVNPFLINLLGYSYELFMGKTIWDIGFMKDVIGNKEKFLELKKNKYARYENLPLETAHGKIIEVEFISNLYKGINSEVIQCNIRDISDRREVEKKNKALLDEKNLILKEVHHRIKNSMNTIRSLLSIQAQTLTDEAAIKALEDTESRVQSMMVLYDKLYRSVDYSSISMKEYLPSLVDEIIGNFPNSTRLTVEKAIDDFSVDARTMQSVGIIINELLTNIMKYAFIGRPDGLVTVSASQKAGRTTIRVRDNGKGIPEGITFENSSGFGLMLVRTLTEQIGGTIKMERCDGTIVVLDFDNRD